MDYSLKKTRINNLVDEVNELHPMLYSLFHKMPSIKQVSKTHGNTEFGADFILTHMDEMLDLEDYIGVIVKSKTITQSSIYDIDRQIKECSMSRLVENGKKRIVLSSIWIITSQNISQNAQEKINHDYTDKKFVFIDDCKLISLIDKYLKDFWYNIELSISEYLREIRVKTTEEDLRYNLIPGIQSDVYIEPDIVKIINEGYDYKDKKKKNLFERIDIKKEIESNRFLIVEGQMGAGKSKLLRHLTIQYSDPNIYIEQRIVPIFIQYKTVIEEGLFTLDSIVEYASKSFNINKIEDMRYLILIDGCDEVDIDIDRNISILKALIASHDKLKNCSAVLATRRTNFLGDKTVFGNNLIMTEITALSPKKMIEFLSKLCHALNIADRLIEDITKSPLMQQLPQSPIAAILLAKLIENNSKDLPANMPELYQKYLELALGRWDIDKGLESQKEYDATLSIIMDLAEYIIDGNVDDISYDVLLEKISDYLIPRNLNIEVDKICKILLDRSGILSKDILNGTVRFSHRTFAEYFYALRKTQLQNLDIENRVFSLYWMNIYYFFIGIKRDCPEFLNSISELIPANEGQAWLKIINLANFYMAGYSTPYSVIENNFNKILLEAANLYEGIIHKRIDSPFKSFPEVILLWWIQFTIRNSYSYDFFSKAIDDCVMHIIDADTTDEKKAYALFFLSVIGIDQNNNSPLDFLLSDYKDKLPITIQVGLLNELKKLSAKNIVEKKGLKSLKKRLSNISKKYIDDIFNISISTRKLT